MGYDIPADHSSGPGAQPTQYCATHKHFYNVHGSCGYCDLAATRCKKHDAPLDNTGHCPYCEGWLKKVEPLGMPSPALVIDLPIVGDAVAQAKRDDRWDGSLPRIARATEMLLAEIDPDSKRAGLSETPARVAKAWQFWTRGYRMNVADVLKVFEDGAEQCDEMVIRRHIPIHSFCEHHLAPIFGEAVIAYIPNGKIVGLSKLDRLADVFARRLQVQERMTNQIAEALQTHLQPAGCGVVIRARHLCIESRGVQHSNSETTTSALRGCFKDDARVRAEFLSLAHNGDK